MYSSSLTYSSTSSHHHQFHPHHSHFYPDHHQHQSPLLHQSQFNAQNHTVASYSSTESPDINNNKNYQFETCSSPASFYPSQDSSWNHQEIQQQGCRNDLYYYQTQTSPETTATSTPYSSQQCYFPGNNGDNYNPLTKHNFSSSGVIVKNEPCEDLFQDDQLTEETRTTTTTSTTPSPANEYPAFYAAKFTLSHSHFFKSSGVNNSHPDEDVRRKRRRERNKVAATKCRHKKKEHVIQLNIESQQLESSNLCLKAKLAELRTEKSKLLELLASHDPYCVFKSKHNNVRGGSILSPHDNNFSDQNNHLNNSHENDQDVESHQLLHYYSPDSWRGSANNSSNT